MGVLKVIASPCAPHLSSHSHDLLGISDPYPISLLLFTHGCPTLLNLICLKKNSMSLSWTYSSFRRCQPGWRQKYHVILGASLRSSSLPFPSCLPRDSVRWCLPAQALDHTDLDALLAQPFTSHVTFLGPHLKWEWEHLAPRLSANCKWKNACKALGCMPGML